MAHWPAPRFEKVGHRGKCACTSGLGVLVDLLDMAAIHVPFLLLLFYCRSIVQFFACQTHRTLISSSPISARFQQPKSKSTSKAPAFTTMEKSTPDSVTPQAPLAASPLCLNQLSKAGDQILIKHATARTDHQAYVVFDGVDNDIYVTSPPVGSVKNNGCLILGMSSPNGANSAVDVVLGSLRCRRWLACARNKLWWMTPEWGNQTTPLPPETQFLLCELEDESLGYAIVLPLIDSETFRATLRPRPLGNGSSNSSSFINNSKNSSDSHGNGSGNGNGNGNGNSNGNRYR